MADQSKLAASPIRVLFCIAVTQPFFELPSTKISAVLDRFKEAFSQLEERFGARVLGTLDDDCTQVGHSSGWPWTSYIMADVPDIGKVFEICAQLRSTSVGDGLLWRYARIEARIGRPLFVEKDAGA